MVAIKDRKKGAAFSNLEQQHSVRTVSFDEICPPASASTATDDSINKKFIGSSTDEVHEQYTTTETDAIVKIQRLWRSCSPRIKRRHSYVSLPECQAITRVFNMGAHCPAGMTLRDRTTVRKLLVLQGVPLSLRLGAAREHLSKLQQDSMACVENVEVSVEVLESVDVILGRNREIEPLLKKAEEQMSEERLAGLVKLGVLEVLEKAVRDADDVIAGAELELLETRKMVDALLPKCT